MRILVTHDKQKQAGGALEADVVSLDVHASTTNGFTADATNKIGTIEIGPIAVGSFYLPTTSSTPAATTQTWYVKVFAVDRGGNKSAVSNQATATPGLIDSTSIIDATIGDAKIGNLAANKITAGTGFINDITVKSIFTLGDASTTGVIKSFGYVAGTTGFSLDKTLLEINQGSIAAAALKIQDSQNLVPIAFADFEFAPAFYANNSLMQPISPATKTVVATGAKFNSQFLQCRATTAAVFDLYLSATATDYNVPVEASTKYIVSAWVKTGATATSVSLKVKQSTGAFLTAVTTSLGASGAWQRISGTITTVAGVTGLIVMCGTNTATIGAGFDIDGVQIEYAQAALNTPSSWKPPSSTFIDGGYIRTGEIRSTSTTTVNSVTQPNWSINMAGGAQFGDATVRGKILVGPSGADPDAGQSYISSGNFNVGTTGWKIDSSGNAEFNTGVFRGSLGVGVVSTNPVIDPSFEEVYALGARSTDGWRQMSTVGTVTSAKVQAGARSGQWALKYAPVTPTYRENLIANPSFEYGTDAWFNVSNAKFAKSTAVAADTGSALLAIQPVLNAASSLSMYSESVPATAGLVYSGSVRAKAAAAYSGKTLAVGVGFYDYTNALIGAIQNGTGAAITTTTFGSYVFTNKTAPAGTVRMRFFITITNLGSFSSETFYLDSVLLEQTATNQTFFHGDTADSGGTMYGWSGPKGRSPSWQNTNQAVYRSAIFPLNKGLALGSAQPYKVSLNSVGQTHGGRITVKMYVGATYATATTLLVDPTDIDYSPVTKGTVGMLNYSSTAAPPPANYSTLSTVMTIPSTAAYAVIEITVDGPGPVFIDDVALIRTGLGGSSELSPAGLRLFDIAGDEAGAFVSNRPNSFTVSKNGLITAQITDSGNASFQNLQVTNDPVIRGVPLDTLLKQSGSGVVSWGGIYNDATSTNTSAGVGVFEIQAILRPQRLYKVCTGPLRINASTANVLAEVQVRYTTATMPGTAAIPTISSPIAMRQQVAFGGANIAGDALQRIFNTAGQTTDLSMRLLLCYSAPVGGATFTMAADGVNDFIEMWVEDCGPYFGNLQIANDGSGTSGTPITRFTSIWQASDWQNYKGDGSKDTRLFTEPPIVLQGYSPGGLGNEAGILLFNGNAIVGETNKTMSTALSTATIENITVKIDNNWWANGINGGVARIGFHNQATIPTTVPTITPIWSTPDWGAGAAYRLDITAYASAWAAGTYKGVALGPALTNESSELGAFTASTAQIIVTYTR
jgi:hypothetical protein